jgi:hypothetical protein
VKESGDFITMALNRAKGVDGDLNEKPNNKIKYAIADLPRNNLVNN